MTSIITSRKSKADIITIGCEDHLQKQNVLKGLALQKLVKYLIGETQEDISVKRILEQLSEKQSEYFVIEKPFKTQKNRYFKRWRFVHLSDFDEYLEIWIREQIIDKSWKICNNCGQKIKASDQFSRKCWKCKKGWYQSLTSKQDLWTLKIKGTKVRMIDYLQNNGYLKAAQLRKRLDFFHFSQGVFSIYEAKNKEKTGLTSKDLRRTLIYPYIVSRCGYKVEKLILIYNGTLTNKLRRELRKGFGEDLPFQVQLTSIRNFLLQKSINIKAIKVHKQNGSYNYEIIPGISKLLTIDLTLVE